MPRLIKFVDKAMTQEEFEAKYLNQIHCGDWIQIAKGLPADCVHCIVTSPPYWGQRNYGCDGQFGLEKTPEEHIEKLVAGFREIRRILRPDGVLWLNYGDKYWGGKGQSAQAWATEHTDRDTLQKPHHQISGMDETRPCDGKHELFKPGDLLGLPWRVALALQADGWWLRSDIVWAKALSLCSTYSGSTMPESVNGWRWQRCRVKVKARGKGHTERQNELNRQGITHGVPDEPAQWSDCPGCRKCEKNGGLVLRRGSWRCTKAHEYLFMLTRSERYFCDMEAVKEPCTSDGGASFGNMDRELDAHDSQAQARRVTRADRERYMESGRNLRDVWCLNPQAYKGAHYATFPEKLVEPCIRVSTSQKGVCPKCGSQWARVIKTSYKQKGSGTCGGRGRFGEADNSGFTGKPTMSRTDQTLGWRATCKCRIQETIPAICYDPFMGSGTVAAVAARLGRNYCGSELSAKYLTEQAVIRVKAAKCGMDMAEVRAGQQALFE